MTTQLELCNQPILMAYRGMLYLLTACSTILLEKLTGSLLVKYFPAFYGFRKFITAFKSACHLSLSWESSIQSIASFTTSWIPILILSFHLYMDLPNILFHSGFPTKLVYASPVPRTRYMPLPIAFYSECYRSNNSTKKQCQCYCTQHTSSLSQSEAHCTDATVYEQTNSKSQHAITALMSFSDYFSTNKCAINVECSCRIF